MANLTFSSPNISDEVKKRTNDFFDLVYRKYKNQDESSEGYKKELLAREDELLTLVKNVIDFEAFDVNGYTALIWAATKGHTEVVKALIEAGANLNAQDKNGYTALIWATREGRAEVVEALIDAKADLNAQDYEGKTALILAARKGRTEVVKALIEAEADLNAQDKNGYTALIWAAYQGHTEIVEALIAADADVNAQDDIGNTALICAAREGRTEVVKALIEAGANLNAQDISGNRALMWASEYGHFTVAKILIKSGANIYLADNQGRTSEGYIKIFFGEDGYIEIIGTEESAYAKYLAGGLPSNVEEVQNLLAFHPIAPSDNREPFPKMQILERMFWNKDWGLDQAYNLIDALKKRKVINEEESAKLKGFCNYKIATQQAKHQRSQSPKDNSFIAI